MSLERLEDRLAPAAGALDPTFGAGGTVTTDFTTITEVGTEVGNAVALQTDGAIVVVGTTSIGGGGNNFALARYLADGSLDSNFSGDGKVATDFNGGADEARGVAIQADGKIVVAGRAQVGGSVVFALARYNPDGKLDDSFGAHGKVTTPGSGSGHAMALQTDGKIVVAGGFGGSNDFVLARYNPDGKLDPTFDADGIVTTDFGNADAARSVAIQADGKIVVAGETVNTSGFKFALARYNPDGSLDSSTFDDDGMVTADFGGNNDEPRAVALQADGKIVVGGTTSQEGGFNNAFALARFNADGSPDSDFDADGKVITKFGSGFAAVNSVVTQAAGGRIVVAGLTQIGLLSQFTLARYNFDGTLDASFGANGTVTTDFGGRFEVAAGMALQADGKIVVAGNANGQDFALARYEGVAPEIAVVFGGADLRSGSTVSFGPTPVGTPVSKTFTIRNLGNLSLTVSSFAVPAGYQLTTATSFPIKLAAGAQSSMSVQLTASTAGVFSGKISIGNNDSNENPFIIGVTGAALAPLREIQVLTGATDIPNITGVVNFGTVLRGATLTRTFTVRNIGSTNLTLGPDITVGQVTNPFFVQSGFGSNTLAPGASTTFSVVLRGASVSNIVAGQVSFATNDSDENPFNFTVSGIVSETSTAPMIRGDSLTRHVDEGGVATLRGHLVDPDPNDELFLSIDWGDGTPIETRAVGRAPFAFERRYLDDPPGAVNDDYLVHFTWFDSGGGSNSKTLPVTVRNVAPQVSVGLPVHFRAGATLSRVGAFTDPGLDSWYATVDYGDGGGPEWLALGPDNRFTLSHRYKKPGAYKVTVTVFDDDGGLSTDTFQVIVQPLS